MPTSASIGPSDRVSERSAGPPRPGTLASEDAVLNAEGIEPSTIAAAYQPCDIEDIVGVDSVEFE